MLDANQLFSNGQNLSGAGATASTNILDLGKTPADGIEVQLTVPTAPTGTTPTLDAVLQFSSSATFASDVVNGPAIAQLSGTAAAQVGRYYFNGKGKNKRRYARVNYTLGGTTPAYSGVICGIVPAGARDTVA